MKIYTKLGDDGSTWILGGIRLRKSDLRIECIGELDELNSLLGVSLSQLNNIRDDLVGVRARLQTVQHELFQWGAMLAGARPEAHTRIGDQAVTRLENEIDGWQEHLQPLTHFILPGGSSDAAVLHLARTVCRRVERRIAALHDSLRAFPDENVGKRRVPTADHEKVESVGDKDDQAIDEVRDLLRYLNRLSDWLFVVSRFVNSLHGMSETKWEPKAQVP
ncbi:MAG TPA: cob(I)yrinic acid a,c-diamide adenosyltransferase [Pirellulaceae bacterium]|nr:cob(I)yrinic acid a,c-diamide adenosyltransferase [Pirellulaceae bacterium]HMO92295.1 cob(I)yrinic acid a,c-diamide adenosyltransferase [Pirellulaceae bacterium]HMP71012.1 cob(I)yrinic acid a,c-diamide adenosyltransferase [Pirellulaceae bacterium]